MAPDRSSTRAGTDGPGRRLVGAALALAVLSGCTAPDAPPPPSPPTTQAPLVVGDGRTVTSLSLGGAPTDAVLRRVEAALPEATRRVERFWGTDWSHEIVVVATGSDADFAAAAPGAPSDMAAVAVADTVDPDAATADGQRIVLGPGAVRMSDHALRIVLAHELFHYAARARTAVDAPRWLTEGVADHVARSEPVPADLPAPAALPSDADFDTDGTTLSTAYDHAWLFARFVADRWGESALRDLYTAAAGPGHRGVDTALREVTGLEPVVLLDQWRAWLAARPRHR
jgi:hypothetical protein